MRTPIAYPVFSLEYEEERKKLADGTGIANLHTIGRNGEFMHIFMEDVHCRTERKMEQLIRDLKEGNGLIGNHANQISMEADNLNYSWPAYASDGAISQEHSHQRAAAQR